MTPVNKTPPPQSPTSPPVLPGDGVPGELLVEVLPSLGDGVRLVDELRPPAVLQHHLQLREVVLALQPALVEQRPVPHHVAGGRFADLALGVPGGPRRVRLPFIGQIANDGQVALFARHVTAASLLPPPVPCAAALRLPEDRFIIFIVI